MLRGCLQGQHSIAIGRPARRALLILAGLLACAGAAAAQGVAKPAVPKAAAGKAAGVVVKRLFVSGSAGGIAELLLPADWELRGRSTPIYIRLARPGSRDYMLITALPVPKERLSLMTDDKLQEIVREGAAKLLPLAVETSPTILPLPAGTGKGYYYALTNKKRLTQPDAPEEFRSMVSGMVPVGGWMAVFNIFSNAKDGGFVRNALAAVASLRWRAAPEPGRAAGDLLADLRLGIHPPDGLKPRDKLLCLSPQTRLLFTQFNQNYASLLGARMTKSGFESFDDGQGDAGSVLYMDFDAPLGADAKSFIGGLLWGAPFPDRAHPDEFYAIGKQLVIWCTQTESHIKRLSQARLEALLFAAKRQRGG